MIIHVDDNGSLQFPKEFAAAAIEADERGYMSHVVVSFANGSRYPVFFVEPVRLQQELEQSCKTGQRQFVEVGLVVVPDLRLETLKTTVQTLIDKRYFDFLRTIDEAPNPWDV